MGGEESGGRRGNVSKENTVMSLLRHFSEFLFYYFCLQRTIVSLLVQTVLVNTTTLLLLLYEIAETEAAGSAHTDIFTITAHMLHSFSIPLTDSFSLLSSILFNRASRMALGSTAIR